MELLPFLVVHGLVVWFGLAGAAAVLGGALAYVVPRRRARAEWRRELAALGDCSPERNWSPGQPAIVSGTLLVERGEAADTAAAAVASSSRSDTGKLVDEESADGLSVRTAEGTTVRIRAPLSLRHGSSLETTRAGVAHSIAAGDPVRLCGRLANVAGGGEAGFRESAHSWELCAPELVPSIAAVAERSPTVRPLGTWSVARGAIGMLVAFGICSTVASGASSCHVEEQGDPLGAYFWEYQEAPTIQAAVSIAAASPFYRHRTLMSLARELQIHDSTGRAVVEASAVAYGLAGRCDLAFRSALRHAAPDVAIDFAGCAPPAERDHLRATALYFLGRLAEASDLVAEPAGDGERLLEAAEIHLLAGQGGRAARALAAWSRAATGDEIHRTPPEEAAAAAGLADALLARAGDGAALGRLREAAGNKGAGNKGAGLAQVLLADATLAEKRQPPVLDREMFWRDDHLAWAGVFLAFEAGASITEDAVPLGCPSSYFGSTDFLVDGNDVGHRTSALEGLALAVVEKARATPPADQPGRAVAACAALLVAEDDAASERLAQAEALLATSNALDPGPADHGDRQTRPLQLEIGLAVRRGDLDRARGPVESLVATAPDAAHHELVQAFRFLGTPGSVNYGTNLLHDLTPGLAALALKGDGRGLPPLMVDNVGRVPAWLYLVAPHVEIGRETLLDMALHADTLHWRDARPLASVQLRLATALRSPGIAAKWKAIVDRHLEAERRRDTALVLDLLRTTFAHAIDRTWIVDR